VTTDYTFGTEVGASRTRSASGFDRWLRGRVHTALESIQNGAVTLVDGPERVCGGNPADPLHATVHVDDARFYRAIALGGALGAAESYIDGHWRCHDLPTLIRVFAANRDALGALDGGAARWRRPALAWLRARQRNTRAGSRRNIAAHYDLGDAFFELFLDPTLTYSCGVFERPDATMEEASAAKYERVCRKLRLGPGHRVLEIGSGWGGFALHAAARHGCHVTTTTVSRRQYERARRRVAEAGLSDRVEVIFEDYRDLRGRYDRLVSIEMIEAVGREHLGRFFRACGERLAADGAMLIQAITVPDRLYAAHTRSVDFIKRYIFPGGELVSLGALHAAAASHSDLQGVHVEDLTPHYAETLRRWRARMAENRSEMRALGLDERFLRMWEYYFCYCEGGFDERAIGLVQVVFDKPARRDQEVPWPVM
jgi:cyclopropane-fatty-acyl-phospholipid synthase